MLFIGFGFCWRVCWGGEGGVGLGFFCVPEQSLAQTQKSQCSSTWLTQCGSWVLSNRWFFSLGASAPGYPQSQHLWCYWQKILQVAAINPLKWKRGHLSLYSVICSTWLHEFQFISKNSSLYLFEVWKGGHKPPKCRAPSLRGKRGQRTQK